MAIEYAYAKYCNERFSLPTEAEIEVLETKIGVALPADFREYLSAHNGGYFDEPLIKPPEDADPDCPKVSLEYMCGINASHRTAEIGRVHDLALFDDNFPAQILPIGFTLQRYIVMLTTHEEDNGVIFLRTYTESFWLADGVEEFFELLTAH